MRRALRIVSLAGGTLVACALGAGAWLAGEIERVLSAPLALRAPQLIVIAPGSDIGAIARQLEAEGWLSDRRLLVWRTRLDGSARRFQAGTYEARPGDSLSAVLARMLAGEIKVFRIRFVEGCTLADMRAELARAPWLRRTLPSLDEAALATALGIDGRATLEGLFFPDTYAYTAGDSDLEILHRAYRRMHGQLAELWQDRAPDLPYRDPYEALIMASIIEKETGRTDERAAIAGVFTRRLALGMKLQTDPSVIYGLGAAFDGNLRRADLERDTPYNTYTRAGLPPTPIAMPGRAALAAALRPAAGSALYFVAKGGGAHHFSDDLSEHNAAVRRYQRRGGH